MAGPFWRGVHYASTSLEEATKYALISLDSTMRSNVTVGPPIDLAVYIADEFKIAPSPAGSGRPGFAGHSPAVGAIPAQSGKRVADGAIRQTGRRVNLLWTTPIGIVFPIAIVPDYTAATRNENRISFAFRFLRGTIKHTSSDD